MLELPREHRRFAVQDGLVGRFVHLEVRRPPRVHRDALSPGDVAPERRGRPLPPERRAVLAKQIPVGRIGTPAEIAAAVVFLASDGAAFVNGAVLDIHGGRMEYV